MFKNTKEGQLNDRKIEGRKMFCYLYSRSYLWMTLTLTFDRDLMFFGSFPGFHFFFPYRIFWKNTFPKNHMLMNACLRDSTFFQGIWSKTTSISCLLWFCIVHGWCIHVFLDLIHGNNYIVLLLIFLKDFTSTIIFT